LFDDHWRADIYQAVELADVAVVHADTTMRDEAANRGRPIGAVNGVFTFKGFKGLG
jgi:hypothetical protein